MKFLDKLNEMTDKAVKSVENTKNKVNEFYKKEGLEGILVRADKGMDNLEKSFGKVADQTTTYIKGVTKSNVIKMEEAKRDSKDEFDAVINSGLAATVNTLTTVAKDLARKAKDVVSIKDVVSKPSSVPIIKKNAFEEFRVNQANNVALESVLKFVGAKADASTTGMFKDSHNNNISIIKNKWYNWNAEKGGIGAISLMAYQLDVSYNTEDPNKVSKEDIRAEAINVLDQMSLRQEVLEKELKEISKELKSEPVKKVVAKKALPRKAVVKKPVAKKTVKK